MSKPLTDERLDAIDAMGCVQEEVQLLTAEIRELRGVLSHASRWVGKLINWADDYGPRERLTWQKTASKFRSAQGAIDNALKGIMNNE